MLSHIYLVISPPICVPLAASTFAPPWFLWPQTGAAATFNHFHRMITLNYGLKFKQIQNKSKPNTTKPNIDSQLNN